MEHIKPPPEMDFASSDGTSVAETWRKWRQSMELFLTLAMTGKTEREQCSAFLYIIGPAGRDIYNTFNVSDQDKNKISILFQKFEGYCKPKQNVTVERYRFNTRSQQEGESIDQYVTALKLMTRNCAFGTLEEELIRDRIVCGVSSEKIKERLLRERDLTLDKAIDLCRAEEKSKTQLKCISEEVSADLLLVHAINPRPKRQPTVSHGSLPNEEAGAVKPISNQHPTSICRNCGYQHKRDKCPAFGKRCNKCHKFNHFARYCRSSKGVSTLTQKEEEEEHSDADELVVGTLNAKQTVEMGVNECFASFRVQDRVIKFKIDTGSQVNVMPLSEYNLMHRKPRLIKSRVKLFGYTGDSLKTVGECTLPVGGHQLEFFVADTSQNPILGLNASQELNLVKVVMNVNMQMNTIQQFKDFFSGLGCLKQPYHIKLDPTVKPVISPPRNQPVTIRDRLKTELNKMESMGVIVAVEEPTDWVNSLVVVEKPKTKQLRICLDPRPLNKAIMREHFQLPTLDDIATRLHGAKVFSKLDANHGYWQIPLDRASQLLTTFNTPFGRYCYTRLPFGISSAQEVFQKRMYQLFGDLPGVETDIDNMLIHGRTEEEHQQRLTAVLKRCQEVHLTLNKEKCQFGVPQVTYLGHCISADGITPDENRVKAILAMPPPKDKKGVERLLGTLNYVSEFVPNMSTVTEHIRVLLGKDVPFVWTWEQEAAFENVKKLLSTAPVLAFYDVKQPVTVSCDASQTGLGAVFLQQERPVAYISRALSDTEQRYAQIEKELLAVVFAFEKFNQYVYGRTVSVQSDHKPLESILKKPLHHAPPRLQRMLLRLQKYDFILSYKPGKEMYIADTLSRAHTTDTTVGEMETELAEAVHLVVSNVPASSKRMREIREATAKDTVLLALRNMIRDGWPDSRSAVASDLQQYWNFREELSEASGILWKGEKVIVPKALRQDMLQKIHAGHMGITKCTQRAKEVIFWPGMSQEIANIVQKCQTCREFQASNAKEPMFQEQVPHGPWEMTASDLFHFNGADYLLIFDYYSKFIEFSRLSDTLSKTIITHTKSIFARHGIPQKVRTDNGPQFSSREYKLFAEKWGFDHITTSPLHPQSNGLAERSVQIIKRMLKKSLATGQDVYLNLLELRNTSIGELGSPAQLLMSRRLQTSLPVKPAQLEPKVINPEHVKSILEKNSRQQKKYYDKGSKSLAPLHIGDSVYIQLDKHWSPATITDIADTPRSYIVTTTEGKTYRRNRRHLQQTSLHQQDADNNCRVQ